MAKSRKWLTFEAFAQMFLDIEKEFNVTQECNIVFSLEFQREEFKWLWTKVKDAYEAFATEDEDLEGDRDASRELFGHCRLGYNTSFVSIELKFPPPRAKMVAFGTTYSCNHGGISSIFPGYVHGSIII